MAIDFVSQIELCVYILEAIFLIMILLDWMYNRQLFIKQTVIQINPQQVQLMTYSWPNPPALSLIYFCMCMFDLMSNER